VLDDSDDEQMEVVLNPLDDKATTSRGKAPARARGSQSGTVKVQVIPIFDVDDGDGGWRYAACT
jgi:hypothetical protein